MDCFDENAFGALLRGALPTHDAAALVLHAEKCAACHAAIAEAARRPVLESLGTRYGAVALDGTVTLPSAPCDDGTSPPQPGLVLPGPFRLEGLLGEGGMGAVWSATDLVSGCKVAIKFLHIASEELVRRLLREARIMESLGHHPNIVTLRSVVTFPEGRPPALVMELLRGESLASRLLARGRLDVAAAVRLLVGVAAGIATAHALGVVHRDVKPANLFVVQAQDGSEFAKVLDFGVAKVFGEVALASSFRTRAGTAVGTPAYMAPEQLFGESDLDPRVDVWALGIVTYEMLAGQRPFAGRHLADVQKRVAARERPTLAEAAPSVPPILHDLVERMLSFERERRPSAEEIGETLRKTLITSS